MIGESTNYFKKIVKETRLRVQIADMSLVFMLLLFIN